MMIGEVPTRPNPTIQVPPWDPYDDTAAILSPSYHGLNLSGNFNGIANGLDSPVGFHLYLPSNEFISPNESDSLSDDSDLPVDAYSCDFFRMYEFKVRRCARGRSHDWTECPYAHPGEKAKRRDPRKYNYSGTACPDYRKGGCKKGDSCEFAHGVFECWLHPARYRTQPCKDGLDCTRRVCFFAHTLEQLRVFPQQSPKGNGNVSSDFDHGSPVRRRFDFDSYGTSGSFVSSPTSILTSPPGSPPSDSPPTSPSCNGSFNSVSELVASMRALQFGKAKMGKAPVWGVGYLSPRGSTLKPGFYSLPSTPTQTRVRSLNSQYDLWESPCQEEPSMERVESGRDLRAKIYAKLSKENSLDRVDSTSSDPDVGWISELVK
ncbi:zinc finger CCCH domain-containing protein 23-like [Mangifera indica]|uniref:zinc finger CCCH domain-containing protein 23-like n=1 Tax=Mangifera indica TaxID=29780 RepID=UPI001CFA60EC|nr:zinc finger CCCH domain-containing protein 23-like [Mangifera indica]